MRSSGYGREALPATWCIPENVIDDHLPTEPVFALHGTLHHRLITWALRCTRFTTGETNWTKLYQMLIPVSYIFVSEKLGSATLYQLLVVSCASRKAICFCKKKSTFYDALIFPLYITLKPLTLWCFIPVVCVTNEREESVVNQHN